MQLVVHPYFKDQILTYNKAACMVQDRLINGTEITFLSAEGLKEIPFATAKIHDSVRLKIEPKTGSIYRCINIQTVDQWIKCNPETTRRIILIEGFNHVDDFWNNQQTRGTFEVWQMYFDNLKPII